MAKSYLQHHGILGQKWGVRRYENEDGTLTEAGKKRYSKSTTRNRIDRSDGSRNTKAMREAKSKNMDEMSNEELRKANERLRLEREYADLTKGHVDSGKKFVLGTGKQMFNAIVVAAAIEIGKEWFKRKISGGSSKSIITGSSGGR